MRAYGFRYLDPRFDRHPVLNGRSLNRPLNKVLVERIQASMEVEANLLDPKCFATGIMSKAVFDEDVDALNRARVPPLQGAAYRGFSRTLTKRLRPTSPISASSFNVRTANIGRRHGTISTASNASKGEDPIACSHTKCGPRSEKLAIGAVVKVRNGDHVDV